MSVPEMYHGLGISSATLLQVARKVYGGMDVSMMSRMKELEAENVRLHKMYVEEKLKRWNCAWRPSKKSGEAISPPRDGSTSSAGAWDIDPAGLRDVRHQPDMLPL